MQNEWIDTTAPKTKEEQAIDALLQQVAARVLPASEVRRCPEIGAHKVRVRFQDQPDVFIQYYPREEVLTVWACGPQNDVPLTLMEKLTLAFPNAYQSVLEAVKGISPSHCWKSIDRAKLGMIANL